GALFACSPMAKTNARSGFRSLKPKAPVPNVCRRSCTRRLLIPAALHAFFQALFSDFKRPPLPGKEPFFSNYVAVADSTGKQTDPYMSRTGFRNLKLHDFKVPSRTRHLHRLHFRHLLVPFLRISQILEAASNERLTVSGCFSSTTIEVSGTLSKVVAEKHSIP